ncbi:MAG TPA: HD domain-containing protein, partial [Firmicutes bacterium]|nr:HD domain-containing protein [Bacillota bacterium]
MPDLVPFQKCIARPAEDGKSFPLSRHLYNVKLFMEKNIKSEPILGKLLGLAGLCHDVAKSHAYWQEYIKKKRQKGPNHAPEGAYLFSYLGYKLLKKEGKWEQYKIYWLWLTRDLADHHGTLKNIGQNYWIGSGQWQFMDLQGINDFVFSLYPGLGDIDISAESLEEWTDDVYDVFEAAEESIDLGYKSVEISELMRELQKWRDITTILIAGDRFDVRSVEPSRFDRDAHHENIRALERFCLGKQDQELSRVREESRRKILGQLAEKPLELVYTLEMPTGYGKTITALNMASWLGLSQGY